MTPEKLNTSLINAMREKIPDKVNLANVLMDILSIGKEAVYRRFRGEVPFTLGEAMIISQKMGVSLDKLTGVTFGGETLFDMNFFQKNNLVDIYYATIENYMQVLRNLTPEKFLDFWEASNRISFLLCLNYDNLSKFYLFKWLYQQGVLQCNSDQDCFEKIEIKPEHLEKRKEFVSLINQTRISNYIWDPMTFLSLVNDLKYFKGLNLISDESMALIKGELIELINEFEQIAAEGTFKTGNKVHIYIANINFETSYSYIETPEENFCFIKVYDLNAIMSRDEKMFNSVKKWIQSLKKFSTLISQSAETERYRFFKIQKDHINSL